jgi:hypothetical protein
MSAIEEIQAAIVKLTMERSAATSGEWVALNMADDVFDSKDGNGWWWVWAKDSLPYYGGILESDGVEDTGFRKTVGGAAITDHDQGEKEQADVDLIVTFHRTIDAQLAILQASVSEIFDWEQDPDMGYKAERMFKITAHGRAAIALARAINGDSK